MFSSLDALPARILPQKSKQDKSKRGSSSAASDLRLDVYLQVFQTQQRWSCKCAFQIKTINQRLQTKRLSNQKSKVCNASWKLLAERPFHSTSGLWVCYTFSICVRGSKAVCKSIINAAAATEEPAVLLHVDENVTIKVSCLYLCLIFNLSIVWCFYSGRKYSVTNPHRSMEWFWFWFWSDGPRETQAAAVDDCHAAARPASGPVGYLPALTEVTGRWDWYVCCAFMLNRCYLLNCECPFSSGSLLWEPTAGLIFHASGDTSGFDSWRL